MLTRRQTTASPSSSSTPSGMSAMLSKKRRPSTDRPSEPSRTAVLSARSPTRSLHAERSAVFPAPVSPVIAVSPREGEKDASRMSATLLTWISSIITSPFPELALYRASRCRGSFPHAATPRTSTLEAASPNPNAGHCGLTAKPLVSCRTVYPMIHHIFRTNVSVFSEDAKGGTS